MRRPFVLVLALLFVGCAHHAPEVGAPETPQARVVVLVSIDGMRHDYLDRADADTPTLDALAASGVRAERLVPVYPTKTFPNHYSLVTGLHPEAHGIVGNTMRDPAMRDDGGRPAQFSLGNREAVTDGRWWGGEPIWVTAERQGVRTGTVSWPGSEAEVGGVRPTDWMVYDGDLSYEARVDSALTWLAEGARFVTLYFEGVDTAGHRFGPEAPETARAMEAVDEALARLVAALRQRGTLAQTDLVIVSDHGMAPVSQAIFLDDVLDLDAEAEQVIWGEAAGVWPTPGVNVDALVARIDALDHVRAYRREATPERLHYRASPRIPPVVIIPDEGWTVSSRDFVERRGLPSGGAHGYDNALPSMHGVFVASGPSFREGIRTAPLSALDVYGLLARALGVRPAPNDGDPAAAARVLR